MTRKPTPRPTVTIGGVVIHPSVTIERVIDGVHREMAISTTPASASPAAKTPTAANPTPANTSASAAASVRSTAQRNYFCTWGDGNADVAAFCDRPGSLFIHHRFDGGDVF